MYESGDNLYEFGNSNKEIAKKVNNFYKILYEVSSSPLQKITKLLLKSSRKISIE